MLCVTDVTAAGSLTLVEEQTPAAPQARRKFWAFTPSPLRFCSAKRTLGRFAAASLLPLLALHKCPQKGADNKTPPLDRAPQTKGGGVIIRHFWGHVCRASRGSKEAAAKRPKAV